MQPRSICVYTASGEELWLDAVRIAVRLETGEVAIDLAPEAPGQLGRIHVSGGPLLVVGPYDGTGVAIGLEPTPETTKPPAEVVDDEGFLHRSPPYRCLRVRGNGQMEPLDDVSGLVVELPEGTSTQVNLAPHPAFDGHLIVVTPPFDLMESVYDGGYVDSFEVFFGGGNVLHIKVVRIARSFTPVTERVGEGSSPTVSVQCARGWGDHPSYTGGGVNLWDRARVWSADAAAYVVAIEAVAKVHGEAGECESVRGAMAVARAWLQVLEEMSEVCAVRTTDTAHLGPVVARVSRLTARLLSPLLMALLNDPCGIADGDERSTPEGKALNQACAHILGSVYTYVARPLWTEYPDLAPSHDSDPGGPRAD